MKIVLMMIIILPAFYFGCIGEPTEMGLMIVASSIAIAFFNIDKIQHFKGAGFEAEMKKVVEEAYATIDNVKEISIPLIVSILDSVVYSGRIGGISIEEKHNLKSDLEVLISKLKIEDKKIDKVLEEFYRHHVWDFFQNFASEVSYGERKSNEIRNKLMNISNRESSNYPSKEDILNIMGISEEELYSSEKEKLDNYLYYKKNHKLKE